MELWKGGVKGYDESGNYIGTYTAKIKREGKFLYKMTLAFSYICEKKGNKSNNYLKENLIYSSNLKVIKRKFKESILLNTKKKVVWIRIFENKENYRASEEIQR
ncbi:hypothetical protein H1W83_29830 (plasmid) [Priestia megaterium]|uniref:hypothetical protein n=1 Tax=Priestia megaterium TaxID=1404 RepID=UPI001ED9E210|nr:hypothetical protein [Priestia megaterium]UKJ83787.1 hypothetical protein H1W83_29830 [Priestia megaterium]